MNTLFQTDDNRQNNPFHDRRVACIGEFAMGNKILYKRLKDWGANLNNSTIAKATNFVIVGVNPNPAKLSKIDTLLHDGFSITILTEEDVVKIFNGENWDFYHSKKEVVKDLDFTIEHFNQHHYTFD
jgi:NAD-dependent DNA ligase